MNQKETSDMNEELAINNFISELRNYIHAIIDEETSDNDPDSMGSYIVEEGFKKTLKELGVFRK